MSRKWHNRRDRPEDQDDSLYSHHDPTDFSTNSPDLDTYLTHAERTELRRAVPHMWRYRWMLTVTGAILLGVILLIVLIGLSVPGRTTTSTSKSPVQPRVEPGSNLVSQLAKGVVFIHAVSSSPARSPKQPSGGSGSGFLIDHRGYIVTNEHVISGARDVVVTLHDGTRQTATVITADPAMDIAVLKIPGSPALQVLSLGDSDRVQLGTAVYALGFPLGASLGSTITVTDGLVSAIRQRQGERWLQISTPVNPGNSGGPVVLAHSGVVVGVVTAKVKEAEAIAFARPINSVRGLVARSVR